MSAPRPQTGLSQTPTILIVEDDARLRSVTAEGLRGCGYETLIACHAAEALACFHQHPEIDLLLTDVRMPGTMDGLALAFAVRRQSPQIPIILMSGHLDPETTPLPAGAAFLRKPCCIGTLMAGIGKQLEERKALVRPS